MLFNLFQKQNVQQIGGVSVTVLDPKYSVTGQISVADVAEIKAAGYDCIMCNRPDAEDPGQPSADAIKRATEKAGLKFFFVPMARTLELKTLQDFKAVVSNADNGNVFAYCRSGNRCTILWKSARG